MKRRARPGAKKRSTNWLEAIDTVVILALRHQREAGYE